MQAIRFEHEDGHGIFCGYLLDENGEGLGQRFNNTIRYILPEVMSRHFNFNSPSQDFLNNEFIRGKHFCAYKSLEQVNEWIKPDEIKIILNHDIKIYLLELSEALVGHDQIAYQKEHIISKQDISSLFK